MYLYEEKRIKLYFFSIYLLQRTLCFLVIVQQAYFSYCNLERPVVLCYLRTYE